MAFILSDAAPHGPMVPMPGSPDAAPSAFAPACASPTVALRPDARAPVVFEAEILHDFIPALQSWYDRGIRLFAFEGLDLTAANA